MASRKQGDGGGKHGKPAAEAAQPLGDTAPSAAPPPARAAPAEPAPQRRPDPGPRFPVVGLGASAGGLAAFEAFFSALPAEVDSGIAFVVVQHLSPDHRSLLVELIQRHTRMAVQEVQDGMVIRPGVAYIIPPNRDMALSDGTLTLHEPESPRGLRLPIDFLFRSLARELRERAICVVLSGMGADGTLGIRAVKGEGGMVMVQAPDTTEHDSMPRSAIATGLVDYVLAPAEMPAQLMAYVGHAFGAGGTRRSPGGPDGSTLKKICALLRAHTGHDFSQYKETTLVRRLERRMALHQIDKPEEYLRLARERAPEVEALFRDLLIGVTSFFRDPDAFKVLEERVLPMLLERKAMHDPLRVWVCGCSTGEEAYSIAMLLQEQMEGLKRSFKVQVFATDIDHQAIEHARAGIFSASIASDVSNERLSRFFAYDAEQGTYRIQKAIRDMVVFSEQDVIRDPPFSKLDLVSCRNLLIYLNVDLQKKLIPLFHYALNDGGALFLGTSETVGEYTRLYDVVDRKWKLYLRRSPDAGTARPTLSDFVLPLSGDTADAGTRPGTQPAGRHDLRELAERALLSHYAPTAVLINGRGEILHIVGRTGKFLEPASGDAVMNILPMAREGLRRELATAVHRAVTHKQPVSYHGLRVKANGSYINANLLVRPAVLPDGASTVDTYLVLLEEVHEPSAGTHLIAGNPSGEQGGRIAELEQELKAKEEYLQTTLEEMETTNEELKSTNEEMQSVNEELQSTNEELETSKEELQSVNEELSTVNAELQDKVMDLSRINSDMNNLLASTGVGTLFVDNQLRVSRFTPAVTQVINLILADIGRPLAHVTLNTLGYDSLVADTRGVLDTLMPKEAEVRVENGAWYLMRIRPYRTMENVIEGAVLTFVDISERKRTEESLRTSEARFHAFVTQAYAGIAETDLRGKFLFVNDQLCETLGFSREELLQKRIHDLSHPDDLARSHRLFEALGAGGHDFHLEKRYVRRDGRLIWVHVRVNAIRDASGHVRSAVTMLFDITERKRLEAALAETHPAMAADLEVLSRLQAILNVFFGTGSVNAMLQETVDAAMAIDRAPMGIAQAYESGSTQLATAAVRGVTDEVAAFWNTVNGPAGPLGAALVRGEAVTVDDLNSSVLRGVPGIAAQLQAGIVAVHAIPLIGRSGRRAGVLCNFFTTRQQRDEHTRRLLDLLARQVSDVIDSIGPNQGRGLR